MNKYLDIYNNLMSAVTEDEKYDALIKAIDFLESQIIDFQTTNMSSIEKIFSLLARISNCVEIDAQAMTGKAKTGDAMAQ